MISLNFRFSAGRYHATPWNRQVNEGAVEWPPSPWRILRALIATWYHKAQDTVAEPVVRSLIEKLAEDAPVFYLPAATVSHTRHYMPYIEGPKEKRTKIFDTFVHILDGERLEAVWPNLTLDEEETKALNVLASRLGYFGRAESLVETTVETQPGHTSNVRLLGNDELPGTDEELVRVIAPMLPDEYRSWRDGYETALAANAPTTDKKTKGKTRATSTALPPGIFEALLADTGDLKRAGWNQPPGARWLDYARPRNAFEVRAEAARRVPTGPLPTVARFAVASQVLPRLTQAVSVAERIHQCLVKFSGNAPVFTGLDADGHPLEGHKHARILCETANERGSITRVTVYAPLGFDASARQALDQLRRVWGHGGHDLQLIQLGVGRPGDFADAVLFASATEWRSLTPFVPTRHAKARRNGQPKLDEHGVQIGSPAHDLSRLIAEAGLPRPTQILPMATGQFSGKPVRWLSFQTERKHGNGSHAGRLGYGFQITFPTPVTGPLAFGYGSHFGLGLFAPAARAEVRGQRSEGRNESPSSLKGANHGG